MDEATGLLIPDLDLIHGNVQALRKGNKLDTVSITNTSVKDLKNYLDEREQLYKSDTKNQFVFLTNYAVKANPISVEAIEKLIKKYYEAFMDGKRFSPHNYGTPWQKGFCTKAIL